VLVSSLLTLNHQQLKASQRVAELLGVPEGAQVMQNTGHLPMDERPQQLAESLLAFIRKTDASQ